MDLNLKGKTVVVTGGATGIGKSVALEFLKEGAKVSICGRTQSKLDACKADFAAKGYEADFYQCDVSDAEGLQKMADAIVEKTGRLDVWVNNAGIDFHRNALEFPDDKFKEVLDINTTAVFYGCKIAGMHMKNLGNGGCIINIESFTVITPHTEMVAYSASKCAVRSMTKTFAANLAPYGVRVVGIIPGMIETEISAENIAKNRDLYTSNIAMNRLGMPDDLAKPIVFVSSECASYITGTDIEVSGGKYAVQDSRCAWNNKDNWFK